MPVRIIRARFTLILDIFLSGTANLTSGAPPFLGHETYRNVSTLHGSLCIP